MTTSLSLFLAQDEDTVALGRVLALSRPDKAIVYLEGDLGAGKTTFSRGFILACGHKGTVKSPTYTLIEPYLSRAGKIYHLDLYRLADPGELEYLGVDELSGDQTLCLIEWPERGKGYLPAPDLTLSLHHQDAGRLATLTAHSRIAESWLANARPHILQLSHQSV